MEHKKVLEKALRIQRKISALNLNVSVGVGVGYKADEPYLFLKKKDAMDGVHFGNSLNIDDKEFITKAKEICKPKFIEIEKLCVDSFDIDLYLDKQEIVRVKSILSKEVALLIDDRAVEINRLFMKEN